MKATTEIPVARINRTGGTQPRERLDDEVVAEYAEAMKGGVGFPPVVIFYDGKTHWLADGFHRVEAADRAGLREVSAEVRQGTNRDAVLFSVGANATHGQPRTNADKRRAVETLVNDKEWGKWTDREIARRASVSQPFVGSIRKEIESSRRPLTDNGYQLEAATAPPSGNDRTYTTKHGTVATMKTGNIGRASPAPTKPAIPSPVTTPPPQEDPGEDVGRRATDGREQDAVEQEKPVPAGRRVTSEWAWSKAIQTMYEMFTVVDERGGIDALLKAWNDEDALNYLKVLEDFRRGCDKYIPRLQEHLSCRT